MSQLCTVQASLQRATAEGGGELAAFIVDANTGLLVAATTPGVALSEDCGSQYAVINNTDLVVSAIAKRVASQGGWGKVNGTVSTIEVESTGLYWFKTNELRDPFGLHWWIIVVESLKCDRGYFRGGIFFSQIANRICSTRQNRSCIFAA
jgi:hypothetical protein